MIMKVKILPLKTAIFIFIAHTHDKAACHNEI